MRATEASRTGWLGAVEAPPAKCITPAVARAPPSAPATAASATTAASADNRRLPNIPCACPDSTSGSTPLRSQSRSPDDMIMILPGARGASALAHRALELRAFELQSPGCVYLGARRVREPDRKISTSAAACGVCCAAIASLAASDEWERPARRRRIRFHRWSARPVVRSRSNSPARVHYLVTFIPCEIVTGGGLTKILGNDPAGFSCSPVHVALRHRPGTSRCVVSAAWFPD